MKNKNILIGLFAVLLFAQCAKRISPESPDPEYITEQFFNEPSELNFPVTVSLDFLQKQVNENMDSIIYEDNTMQDSDAADKYKIKVLKSDEILLDADGDELLYTVPMYVDLAFKKEILGFDIEKELQLDIEIDFASEIQLQSDWSYKTRTRSKAIRLKSDPEIQIGFISIPVSSIIELVLDYSMSDIATAMDDNFSESFDLSEVMKEVWAGLQQPIHLSEEYNSWLLMTPKNVAVNKIDGDRKYLRFTIGVTSDMDIKVGKKPVRETNYDYPLLKQVDSLSQDFYLSVPTEISYKEMSDLLNESLVGFVFEHGGKEIVLTKVDVTGNGRSLVVKVSFKGDAEGEMYLTGVPKFDHETQTIYIDKFDYDIKSKKALLKLASWIFKGSFKKNIESELRYSFKENVDQLSAYISEGFNTYAGPDYLNMKFAIETVKVDHIFVTEDGLKMHTEVRGSSRIHYGM